MAFSDLFDSGEHSRNLGHFACIVNMARANRTLSTEEEVLLQKFAGKLDISEDEYQKVLKKPELFPIHPYNSVERRLERLHDLLTVILSDHHVDEEEVILLKRYAIGLGFSSETADNMVKRSLDIFSGKIAFDDYLYLLNKQE